MTDSSIRALRQRDADRQARPRRAAEKQEQKKQEREQKRQELADYFSRLPHARKF
jgi:hypothetical protein